MKLFPSAILLCLCFAACGAPDHNAPDNERPWFRHHFIQQYLESDAWGQTALCDVDGDGDLDFVTGRRAGVVVWFSYLDPDTWTRHPLAERSPSDVGGIMLDVDADGRPDMVAGGSWYRNPGEFSGGYWQNCVFDSSLRSVHDIVAADLDGDGRDEVVTMAGEMQGVTRSEVKDLRYYRIPGDPCSPWEKIKIGDSVHSGLAVADIDGDGDVDIVRSDIWLENDGSGGTWTEHRIVERDTWDPASQAAVCDLDRDGRMEVVLAEGEISGARIAWFSSPADPKTEPWIMHLLSPADTIPRGPYHSLAVADFDSDGDPDIFAGEMEWLGQAPYRWFIWKNDGEMPPAFSEHVILDNGLGTHNAVAGDVDGDGDIDLAGKLWRPRENNANNGANHADYLENLTIP